MALSKFRLVRRATRRGRSFSFATPRTFLAKLRHRTPVHLLRVVNICIHLHQHHTVSSCFHQLRRYSQIDVITLQQLSLDRHSCRRDALRVLQLALYPLWRLSIHLHRLASRTAYHLNLSISDPHLVVLAPSGSTCLPPTYYKYPSAASLGVRKVRLCCQLSW